MFKILLETLISNWNKNDNLLTSGTYQVSLEIKTLFTDTPDSKHLVMETCDSFTKFPLFKITKTVNVGSYSIEQHTEELCKDMVLFIAESGIGHAYSHVIASDKQFDVISENKTVVPKFFSTTDYKTNDKAILTIKEFFQGVKGGTSEVLGSVAYLVNGDTLHVTREENGAIKQLKKKYVISPAKKLGNGQFEVPQCELIPKKHWNLLLDNNTFIWFEVIQ